MSYRQYTKCTTISGFVGFTWVQYVMTGGALVVAGLLAAIVGVAFVPGAEIAALSAIIAYCLWWLYQRLICLGGDVCAVGFVLSVETPDEKSGLDSFDTDYSLNLVLAPTTVGISQEDLEKSPLQGYLVKKTSDIASYSFLGYHLPFSGDLVQKFADPASYPPYSGFITTACMHAEFEGGGVYDLLQACYAALALATAAAVACAVPIIGWIACAILSIAAGVVTLAGIFNALNDKGNPADVNPCVTSVHAAGSPDGAGADVLVVKGTWVYDSAHTGWNEIHPIKQCQLIGTMIDQGWNTIQVAKDPSPVIQHIPDMRQFIDTWCGMLADACDPGTIANQQLPQNQWLIHPLVDGCEPIEPPPPPR
jgi:hypothetical protein